MPNCKKCNKETKNKTFCSKICSGRSKETKTHYCKGCLIILKIGWTYKKYCDKCRYTKNPNFKNWNTITLKEYSIDRPSFQYHARIRSLARTNYKKHFKNAKCQKCGYNKFYEVCHIKPISQFPLTSTIGEVNNINNLIALCPNCHWELDNGLIQI